MKKRLLSLLLAAACLMPLSGCDWGEEPEETYDTLSQYYQQSDSTKQDTRLTSFGLPYLQGETWDPITCADGAQQTLGALLYESLYKLGTDFLPQPCLAESASYDAESYALTRRTRYRWAAAPTAMPRTRAGCIWPGERTGGRIRPCRWSASS